MENVQGQFMKFTFIVTLISLPHLTASRGLARIIKDLCGSYMNWYTCLQFIYGYSSF